MYDETCIDGYACLSCVAFSSNAIDINIPGADPTVSKDAYQNYRKTDADAQQMERDVEKDIKTYMPKQVVMANFDLNDIIYSNRGVEPCIRFFFINIYFERGWSQCKIHHALFESIWEY